mmetsp:Transcript_25054/g.41274  ORF Transcript_25054/g.41274 Transcript_25054/m.41274 type:complete len:269 (+) Transcript_25054:184-990(+)
MAREAKEITSPQASVPLSEGYSWVPYTDVRQGVDSVLLYLEVPGVRETDVQVEVCGDFLTIRGQTCEPDCELSVFFQHSERRYGPWLRKFVIPGLSHIKPEQISASLADGVLRVQMLKHPLPSQDLGPNGRQHGRPPIPSLHSGSPLAVPANPLCVPATYDSAVLVSSPSSAGPSSSSAGGPSAGHRRASTGDVQNPTILQLPPIPYAGEDDACVPVFRAPRTTPTPLQPSSSSTPLPQSVNPSPFPSSSGTNTPVNPSPFPSFGTSV